ncbi:MAG: hypothetical protein H6810_12305 [Phycisphaeraceae bacterium]|nr:MAG: hypothetical protein H6810_12305 [Phycisphaeraceae bacterium]
MRSKMLSAAACGLACLASTGLAARAGESGAANLESSADRHIELTVPPGKMGHLARNLWGEQTPAPTGSAPRGCTGTSTYLSDGFNPNQWTAQAGFAEGEIMAASYTVAAAQFPIRIDTLQGLFVTSQATVTTTTEWSVLVWEGTPNNGTLVASFSSDDVILPHLVMPPGTNATVVTVSVDPGDPEQIVVQDDGSHKFSIGFRIDHHNNQTQNPCFTAPPSNSNAFPATDVDGLANSGNNWLFGVNCGSFGCPPNGGWSTFAALNILCRPSGDWALSADWTSLSCTPGVGACCLPDGSCSIDSQEHCQQVGGAFQGDGTVCEDVVCVPLPQACCFASTGNCLNLDPNDCLAAGGVPGGVGSTCATTICFPEGACCLPDGSCVDGVSPEDCTGLGGTFEGDGTTCATTNCPAPMGACCFATGFCLELTESDCTSVGGAWNGPGSTCADNNQNGTADICEAPAGCNDADVAEPYNVLDLADISGYITAFVNQDPIADIADPTGVWDLADLSAFVSAFLAGCP